MDLQIGDILAYRANDWIAKLSMGKYNHIAGISGFNGDTIGIIESHMKSDGVVEIDLDKELYSCIDVYRVPGGLTEKGKCKLIYGMREKFVNKIPYDLPSFFSKFARSTLGFLLKGSKWRKSEPLFNNKDAFDCAETWATAHKRFLGIEIVPSVHVASVTPSDYGRSKGLDYIGKLEDLC